MWQVAHSGASDSAYHPATLDGLGNRGAIPAIDLVAKAEAAAEREQWLAALDLASQALAADPKEARAAALVGQARQRLDSVGTSSVELRQLTVVAVDMHRSTAIAADIGPERMRELMLELYGICAEALTVYEGRVTKYLGDGVLAQFGYPVAREDDARRAVLASLAMLDGVRSRAGDWRARFGTDVSIRIGIDSGVAAVGPMDASPWSGDELAGDPPNIASRTQATAEPMTIRITQATKDLVGSWYETLPVGPVVLKNYPAPVVLHSVLGESVADSLQSRAGMRAPLIGRDEQLAVLNDAWHAVVTAGERRVVSIVGEAGIGKSRLADQIIATAVASGATQVTFACSRLHETSSLRPVARALGRFFRLSPLERENDALALDAIRRQLDQLPNRRLHTDDAAPLCGWLLGIRSAVDVEPEELRRRAFEAVLDLLEAIAANTGLVLCADDVDAADPSTRELLKAFLARPATRTLVLLTSRDPVPDLASPDESIGLEALDVDHGKALVRSVAPKLDDDAVAAIVASSDGVPYFLEEQAASAREGGGRISEGGAGLSVFLAARLDELGGEAKRLLGEIAVAGDGVSVDSLRLFSERGDAELDELLDGLCMRRVLLRRDTQTGEIVRFRHSIMREAVYDAILVSQRNDLHRRIAGLLADPARAAAPEDLAHHLELAGEGSEAAIRWLEAGRAAAAGGAGAEAIELYRRCLGVLARSTKGARSAELELEAQFGLGTAISTAEGYTSPGAREAFERAVALGEELRDSKTIFPAIWGTSSFWFVLGEHRLVGGLVDRMLRIAREEDDPRYRYEAGFVAGYAYFHLGDFEGAREELELARNHVGAEPVADFAQDPGVVATSTLAVVHWFRGQPELSREVAAEALDLVGGLDPAGRRSALTECWVNANLAWRAELDGRSAEAMDFADRALAIATERTYLTWLGAGTLHRSIALCRLGRLEEGLPTLRAMVDAWRSAGRDAAGHQLHPVLMTPYFGGRLAEALVAAGEGTEAKALADELLAETAASGERFWDPQLAEIRARAEEAQP